jgi:CRP/FNR family transcriptional regulator
MIQSRFLLGLSAQGVQAVLGAATTKRFKAKTVVARQGEPATELFLITAGRARHFFTTPDGQKRLLQWLGPGEIIGAATLLPERSSYRVGTETVKDTTVLVWSRVAIRALAHDNPRLLENALLIGADYVDWFVAAHTALTSESARERLAGVLVALTPLLGREVREGIELDITNDELANAANITQYTASRLLNEWQRTHAVIKRRGRVILLSPQQLFKHTA